MIKMRRISSANIITLAIRICRAKRRMHETQVEHVHRILLRPVIQFLPVDAFVDGSICDWQTGGLGPMECDQADVAVAHRGLAEEVEAVL